jgi:hypothetical protein
LRDSLNHDLRRFERHYWRNVEVILATGPMDRALCRARALGVEVPVHYAQRSDPTTWTEEARRLNETIRAMAGQ